MTDKEKYARNIVGLEKTKAHWLAAISTKMSYYDYVKANELHCEICSTIFHNCKSCAWEIIRGESCLKFEYYLARTSTDPVVMMGRVNEIDNWILILRGKLNNLNMQLVDGKIPPFTPCPYVHKCQLALSECYHEGIKHPVPFSCASARGFAILEKG